MTIGSLIVVIAYLGLVYNTHRASCSYDRPTAGRGRGRKRRCAACSISMPDAEDVRG